MQAKHLRSVNRRKRLDSFKKLLQATTLGNLVPSVETKVVAEHVLSKPDLQDNQEFLLVFATAIVIDVGELVGGGGGGGGI